MQTEDADSWPVQVEGKPPQSAQVGVTHAPKKQIRSTRRRFTSMQIRGKYESAQDDVFEASCLSGQKTSECVAECSLATCRFLLWLDLSSFRFESSHGVY